MKRYLAMILALLLLGSFACAEKMYTEQAAPEEGIQSAIYDLLMEQAEILCENMIETGVLEAENAFGILSEELYGFIRGELPNKTAPKFVMLALPNESFGNEANEEMQAEYWGSVAPESLNCGMAMQFAQRVNSSMGENYQAEFLDLMSVYTTAELPDFNGVAFAAISFEDSYDPWILMCISEGGDGRAICKTGLLYHRDMNKETISLPYFASNLWGEAAFDYIVIR